jgi:hypothetical protein
VDQVGQTPCRVGPGVAGRPGFEAAWPEPWLPCIYTRSPSQWRKSVETAPPGQPTTTWCQTDLSKSVEVPFTPINTPPPPPSCLKLTHHTLFVVLYLYRFRFSSSCAGEAMSGVESRVFARGPKVISEIGELLYLYLSL